MRQQKNRNESALSLRQRISRTLNKLKNKDRYKNAAYYTLSSENYNPGVFSLFLCFRSSGLGIWDSFFNALYIYAGEKERRCETLLKRRYGHIAPHPCGYDKGHFRSNFWSSLLKVMNFVPKVASFPSRLLASHRAKRARGENSLKNFERFTGFCKRRTSYILPALAAVLVGWYIYAASDSQLVLNVSYDGKQMGNIQDRKVVNDALRAAEDTLSESTGINLRLSGNVTYSAVKTDSPVYVGTTELYSEILAEAKKDYVTAYGLYIDGTLVAPLENRSDIEAVLSEVSGDYAEIANGIQILKQDYPRDAVKTAQQLREILGAEKPTVLMSTQAVAPQASDAQAPTIIRNIPTPINTDDVDFSNAYSIDDSEKVLELNYRTEKYEQSEVVQEYNTVYEYDPDAYVTSKYVKQQGVNGKKLINEKVVYLNGVEESRTVVSEQIISETVDKIIVVGLKEIPEDVMIWPVDGKADESFGWRLRDESYMEYHAGVDICAPKGTAILAAASGVVERAGDFNNGYGKMVLIHHPDGKETLYAHMNDIYVIQGDIITQGTAIGEVGATGDATGNHVHFEVHIDGNATDPLNYLVPN